MTRSNRLLLAAAAAAAVAAPAAGQTMLDRLLSKVVRPRQAGAAQGMPAAGPADATASMTPAQSATLQRLLSAPLPDQRIAADRAAAMPLIVKLINIGACAQRSEAWNAINRESLRPQTYRSPFYGELVPMGNLKYHDKSSCLDVARITDWSKPALNALKLRVYYISPQSGEAKGQSFELQKSSEGVWMVRELGVALS